MSVALAQFAPRIEFLKEEVFDICGALALGESLLRQLGLADEATRLAELFDAVEGRLAEPQLDGADDSSSGS
jgi:hypothetical protein